MSATPRCGRGTPCDEIHPVFIRFHLANGLRLHPRGEWARCRHQPHRAFFICSANDGRRDRGNGGTLSGTTPSIGTFSAGGELARRSCRYRGRESRGASRCASSSAGKCSSSPLGRANKYFKCTGPIRSLVGVGRVAARSSVLPYSLQAAKAGRMGGSNRIPAAGKACNSHSGF